MTSNEIIDLIIGILAISPLAIVLFIIDVDQLIKKLRGEKDGSCK